MLNYDNEKYKKINIIATLGEFIEDDAFAKIPRNIKQPSIFWLKRL